MLQLTGQISFRVPLFGSNAKPKCSSRDGTKICQFVLFWIQSPYLVSQIKLLCKSDAECLESSSTGYFVTQIQQKMHILNSHYQRWKWLLCGVVGR